MVILRKIRFDRKRFFHRQCIVYGRDYRDGRTGAWSAGSISELLHFDFLMKT
jgi:hypothetical protein